ncbi:MAG: YdbL family protein [Gammaproteobacteria bacterium]|nr:DUF1318 domain-containing protein [Gammaproteobacteria bacterium]
MFRFAAIKIVALSLALSSCVTINVYFPAAAAQQAADRIIEDVWGSQASKQRTPATNDEQGMLHWQPRMKRVMYAALSSALDFIVAPAYAQADLNISTPAIRQLTQSMEARHAQLKQYYDSGAIGLTRDGLIEVRDQNAIPLAERNRVRKLVAEENADRANLYREIAVANQHPEWEADIRATFAERWISKAAAGWYYQDANGNWKQK